MPLLKLWNSLRGQSTNPAAPLSGESQASEEPATKAANQGRAQAGEPSTKSSFGIFRGGPHSGLRKRLKMISACSVLEIGVGDGSRAIATMEALSHQSDSIRYFGIDEFEMAGGVNLKEFHQTLRNHGIHPKLFPGSVDRALVKIAHTIGAIDLILVTDASVVDENPAIAGLLARIAHQETVVLVSRSETWISLQVSSTHSSRRVA